MVVVVGVAVVVMEVVVVVLGMVVVRIVVREGGVKHIN